MKIYNAPLHPIDHSIYQTANTLSVEFSSWKLISNTCQVNNTLFSLVMATMGMRSPCGFMNSISSHALINMHFDDRINKCIVSNILIELNLYILVIPPNSNNFISSYSDTFLVIKYNKTFSLPKQIVIISLNSDLNESIELTSVKFENI